MNRTNLCVTVIVVSTILFLSGCQSNQTKTITSPEVLAEFDIAADAKHILLPVWLEGKEYQFVLDTGASNIVFDDSFRDKLGKRFLWPKTAELAYGKKAKAEYFFTPDANLGPLSLQEARFVNVFDLDLIPGYTKNGGEFMGVIGMTFLQKYIVQIDFDNKKVTFFKGKKDFDLFSFFKPRENKHPEWGEPVPLKSKLFDDLIFVKGNLTDDMPSEFVIDSGWPGFNALNGKLFRKVKSSLTIGDNDENKSSYKAIIPDPNYKSIETLSIGKFKYANVFFRKNNMSVLGLRFLSRHLVTFDFPNKKMYLKKGQNFDRQQKLCIYIGNTGCVLNADDYSVIKADPNSLAYKKGIREKDILIKINDNDISSLTLSEFMKLPFSANEHGEVLFTFKGGDGIFIVKFMKLDLEENKK